MMVLTCPTLLAIRVLEQMVKNITVIRNSYKHLPKGLRVETLQVPTNINQTTIRVSNIYKQVGKNTLDIQLPTGH